MEDPIPDQGVPPSQVRIEGTPIPGQDRGGTPSQVRIGVPPLAGWGYPLVSTMGVPPVQVPGQDRWSTPNWNTIVCTCDAAGGMPLTFTQEDFLVDSASFGGCFNSVFRTYDLS